jgi:D-3-phosphoglycerate dehydrogenase / 2-oxoglutarate reductase
MYKIHCLNKISKVGLKALPETYEMTDDLNQADAVLVRSAVMHDITLNEKTLTVARAGAGVNNIPLDDYAKRGVVVFNTPGANANAVKELTIAGMLLASRDIIGGIEWLKAHKDDENISKTVEKAKAQFAGNELYGKSIGIIGLGAIGLKLARACHDLGMKVYGYDRKCDKLKGRDEERFVVEVDCQDEICPRCDFISINIALTEETKHIINKDAISKMKNGVIVLNFARAALINDDDMEEALLSKKVRKYVTDFPTYRSANMEGVINIPHLGASTEEAEDNCAFMASRQLSAFIETGEIVNSVNFPDIKPSTKQGQNRLVILHEKDNMLLARLTSLLSEHYELLNVSNQTNDKYGVIIVDLGQTLSQEHFDLITQDENVIRCRLI